MKKRIVYFLVISFISLVLYLLLFFLLKLKYQQKDFIVFLNVGNGDSALIHSKGEYLLVDAGPSTRSLSNISKFIKNKKDIKDILITHLHSDHYLGVFALEFENLYLSNHSIKIMDHCYIESLNKYCDLNSKNIFPLNSQDTIKVGNFSVNIISPVDNCISDNLNLCSIAYEVVHANGEIVLSLADLEKSNYNNLSLQNFYRALKVPHQGSIDSFDFDFFSSIKIKHYIFSIGENNYGHPSQVWLNYVQSKNSEFLITEEVGDIVLFFD